MKAIEAGYEILDPISVDGIEELKKIERAARTCYKSEDKITEDGSSARKMVAGLIKSGHEAMLEHGGLTVRFVCDRGVSHELVRHRMASFAQESTRYCNYSKDKFGNELTFVMPTLYKDDFMEDEAWNCWVETMKKCEESYMKLIKMGVSPQMARSVLPNSLKTEVVVTANWREWRHILSLRCAPDAHPDIRCLMIDLLEELHDKIPVLFDDIWEKYGITATFKG
jgi:thymidylate synthase (FAD)